MAYTLSFLRYNLSLIFLFLFFIVFISFYFYLILPEERELLMPEQLYLPFPLFYNVF